MSNVIQVLAEMGSKPRMLSAAAYAANVSALDADAAQRQALIGMDRTPLNGWPGGRKRMRSIVWPTEACT